MTTYDQRFGPWLRDLMMSKGISVAFLGEKIARGPVAIFRWRNGTHHPRGRVQYTLAKALGVPVTEIRQRVFFERQADHAAKATTAVSP